MSILQHGLRWQGNGVVPAVPPLESPYATHDDISQVLVTETMIKAAEHRMAQQIAATFADNGRPLVFLGVMNGALPFLAGLTTEVGRMLPHRRDIFVDHFAVSSMGANGERTESSGKLDYIYLNRIPLGDTDVVLVEDIIDSGLTCHTVVPEIEYASGRRVSVATLCWKNRTNYKSDWQGFEVEGFVVGYGLDYKNRYRNLPYIGLLKPEVYQ